MFVLATGMVILVAASGRYLGLVHSSAPSNGVWRRLIDAIGHHQYVLLFPFALRYHLRWLVSGTNTMPGPRQLLALLSVFTLAIFASAFAIETALRRPLPAVVATAVVTSIEVSRRQLAAVSSSPGPQVGKHGFGCILCVGLVRWKEQMLPRWTHHRTVAQRCLEDLLRFSYAPFMS